MKRIIGISLICVILMLALTACNRPLTMEEFKKKAEQKGLVTTFDTIDGLEFPSDINDEKANVTECVLTGYPSEHSSTALWGCCYLITKDRDSAARIFASYKAYADANSGSKTTSSVGSSAESFSITTAEGYGYLSRVDNTMLIIEADVSAKSDVNSFVKSIGY